jgi:hypothetical protein
MRLVLILLVTYLYQTHPFIHHLPTQVRVLTSEGYARHKPKSMDFLRALFSTGKVTKAMCQEFPCHLAKLYMRTQTRMILLD